MLRTLSAFLLDQLAPCYCELCLLPSRRALPLCLACERELPANTRACRQCAVPLAAPGSSVNLCGQCLQQPPPFSATSAAHIYAAPLDDFIKRLKFNGELSLLPLLSHLLAGAAEQALLRYGKPDLLVPVPLHWRRQWQRGFNQADVLARQLTRHPQLRDWSLQVNSRLCRRSRATAAQLGLDHSARQANIARAFTCQHSVLDQHVVIVDDVMTTGATVGSLALELKRAGAARVDVWCCARTPGH